MESDLGKGKRELPTRFTEQVRASRRRKATFCITSQTCCRWLVKGGDIPRPTIAHEIYQRLRIALPTSPMLP